MTMAMTPGRRWLIMIAVMSATLMQILDTTIVNVALPHMQGSLGASPDEISWTLTSYLLASAIFMPLTGYFSDRLGRLRYLLFSIAGFTLASAACGASISLSQLVMFRLLQGVFGAALAPLSQAILVDIHSPEERGKAMAIWGMGVMVGPILGPTLGGYLTDIANWRWTFYVNVPIGILSLLLAWRVVPDSAKKARTMDWWGLLFIVLAIGGVQYVLDRGNQQDWFSANDIRCAAVLSLLGIVGFMVRSLHPSMNAIFDVKIFKDRNFTIASLLIAVMGIGLYGTMVLLPMLLENVLNYPVLTSGLTMAPRGLSGMLSMLIVGKLINKVDARLLIAVGILLSAGGVAITTNYSQNIDQFWLLCPLLLQGFGLGMIFVPLGTIAFATLAESARVEATGLYSLLRTIGSSLGISVTMTLFTRHIQIAWNQLGGFIQPYNPALQNYLGHLPQAKNQVLGAAWLGNVLSQQAQIVAYINTFAFICTCFLCMLPLLLLLKKQPKMAKISTAPAAD